MNGFESFQVSAWLDGALLIWTDKVATVGRTLKRASKGAMAVATVAASVTAVAGPADVRMNQSFMATSFAKGAHVLTNQDEVPAGYWPRLVSSVRSWEPVAPDDDELSSLPLI